MAQEQKAIAETLIGVVGLGLLAIPVAAVSMSAAPSEDHLWVALRLAALEGFTLVFANILIGAFRPLFNRLLGSRAAHRLHVGTGAIGFLLAVSHAVMLSAFGLAGYSWAFVWIGPMVLALLVLTILVALWRRKLQQYWRWIHRLNYLVFAAVLVHGLRLGSDFAAAPWLRVWFLVCAAVVFCGLVYRVMGLGTRRRAP